MRRFAFLALGILTASLCAAGEWRGFVGTEHRWFSLAPLDPDQHSGYASVVLQPEYYVSWNEGRQALTLVPFYRWDQHDRRRTHGDIRELFWLYVGSGFEWRVGVRKVFWGVTESQHLVDILNQTDFVEDIDGEDKLGQPMASATLTTALGNVEFHLLPYFRERRFPGEAGRPRTAPRIDDEALYESARKDRHVDWALRWTRTIGNWDVGLSHFYGTAREPRLLPRLDRNGEPVLQPFHELIHQTGLDVQGAAGAWVWKLEAIRRASRRKTFGAMTGGFEYTFYGALRSVLDVGILLEYSRDSRGSRATSPFQDDVMMGIRLTPNDLRGTQFLFALVVDRISKARLYRLELSRRLTDHIKLTLEARAFQHFPPNDPLYGFRRDHYVQLGLAYHF